MSRLVWDSPGEKVFEAGVEKGVLYVDNQQGVPWNGLISVNESYTGGDVSPRYVDGEKVYNRISTQEFESEITAYTYPDEFNACLGLAEIHPGLFTDEQPRSSFGISYRNRVGDGIEGDRLGSKIHLIYNAIATPNQIDRQTMTESPTPTTFSWGIQTSPAGVPGYRRASHFVLDSTKMGPRLFEYIEDRLYGAPGITPRLLSPSTLIGIVGGWPVLYPSPNTYPSLDSTPGGP